jgi:hypothetical protein
MRAIALLALIPLAAHSAEVSYCNVYATRVSALALRQLIGIPDVDASTGRFLWRKSYTACVNADEKPPIPLSTEEQPIVDGRVVVFPPMKPDGVVPATDATDATDAPADVPVAPKAKASKTASTDQALCTRNGLRTVYTGHRWRCRK